MSTKPEDPKPSDNLERLKQEASACGSGCSCHAAGPSNRVRWIVGIVILVAAAAFAARAMIKNSGASAEKTASGFAALPAAGQAPALVADAARAPSAPRQPARNAAHSAAGGAEGPSGRLPGAAATDTATAVPATVAVKELGTLAELNTAAADTGGVFVYLPGKNEPLIKAPLAQMRSAAQTIESQTRNKIGLFTLKPGSRDYEQIATQMSMPGVLAAVKGRGMVPVSGDITEAKLIQGFVAASSAGGCGPSGCGPSGCK